MTNIQYSTEMGARVTKGMGQMGSIVHTVSLIANLWVGLGEMLGDVVDEVFLLTRLLCEDFFVEFTGLLQITVVHLALVVNHTAVPGLLARHSVLRSRVEIVEAGRVVRRQDTVAPLLGITDAIAAQRVESMLRTVDWELREVGTESITLSIVVGQSADLEDC